MKNATRNRIRRLVPFLILVGLTLTASPVPAGVGVWTSHGPTNVGWVNDLAIANSVAYAATLNGVFRSDDRGASWRQSGLEGESIFQIVARSGAAVVLAATYGYEENLYASRDGGETWAPIPGLSSVTAAAIDPGNVSTLYAGAANAAIWKSADAGASWQQVSKTPGDSNESVQAFAFDSHVLYMLTYSSLFKSLDGGVTWVEVRPVEGVIPNSAVAAGAAPGVVYAAIANNFCRSGDSAATWTCTIVPFSVFSSSPAAHILEVPSDGPTAPPRLLVSATQGVFLSSDVGATWTRLAGGLESAFRPALASDASGSLVLAGTDTQVFRSQDRGDSWASSIAGLKSVWISALALDPRNPATVWAGGIGNWGSGPGLFRSTDAGLSWSPAGGPQGPQGVNAIAIDPERPSTMYAGWDAVYRTEDGGQTWTFSVPDPVQGMNVLALDPALPQRVWAGTHSGLFRSDDSARTWEPPSIAQGVYSILFDDRHPDTIYAGSYWDVDFGYNQIYGGSIFVSHDGGASFTKGTHEFGDGVLSIAQDPFQDGVLYVAAATAGVFRSADGGVTWVSASAGLPNPGYFTSFYTTVLQIVADPVRPGRLYCSTFDGVFRTIDGAQTWRPFSDGLAPLWTAALVISPDGRKLYAGTVGGGVYDFDYQIFSDPLDLSVGSDNSTRLLWTDVDGRVELESLDSSGASVSAASYGPYGGWNARALADGSDGLTRVLWNHLDGSTGVQFLGPTGENDSVYRYGPVGNWTAVDVSVSPDNTTHLLWTNADGRMGLGSLDGSGALVNGPSYGPYSGWIARSISHGADGLTRVLWTRTDGTVGLSFFGAGGIVATHRFDPVSGRGSGWTARDIAVASDNRTRILWAHTDGRMALWSVDNSGAVSDSESVYEPPASGQAATRVSAGADGSTRVLWTSPEGNGTVWLLGLDNVFQSSFGLN